MEVILVKHNRLQLVIFSISLLVQRLASSNFGQTQLASSNFGETQLASTARLSSVKLNLFVRVNQLSVRATSPFGQAPPFGGCGLPNHVQLNPFGSNFDKKQSAFGAVFRSSITTAFVGASSATVFGKSSSLAFGATHFGAASAPAFGSSSSFGQIPFEQQRDSVTIVLLEMLRKISH